MKTRITKKELINTNSSVKGVDYCELQWLLSGHAPVNYNCGVYGWNFDVYRVYGVTICTGYRNMPAARAEQTIEFETNAKKIMSDNTTPYEKRTKKVEKLLHKFCILNGGY